MSTITVIPREIRPGDRIERMTRNFDTVWVEVEKVTPQKVKGVTKSYGIRLVITEEDRQHLDDDVLATRVATWPTYSHYRRFTLMPSAKVKVQRDDA